MCKQDGSALGRPAGMLIIKRAVRQSSQVIPVGVDGIQFIVAVTNRFEDDRLAIWGPIGAMVVRWMIRQVDGIRTIGINNQNFVVARKFFAKYDAGTIWRPVRAGTDLCSWNFCQR